MDWLQWVWSFTRSSRGIPKDLKGWNCCSWSLCQPLWLCDILTSHWFCSICFPWQQLPLNCCISTSKSLGMFFQTTFPRFFLGAVHFCISWTPSLCSTAGNLLPITPEIEFFIPREEQDFFRVPSGDLEIQDWIPDFIPSILGMAGKCLCWWRGHRAGWELGKSRISWWQLFPNPPGRILGCL